ncbi:MAG TPA: type II toxin-antitoxin system RelE/ParE family toxin [Bacteroidia bacterium]|jgi:plasmid stabilization system protein ParE|nr:type II toxin-antitoxin system RelE/ParE family toxin [Bacteroidia bacterium]
MSNKVFWSEKAKNDYKGILNYLDQNWSSKEVIQFADKLEQNIGRLVLNPEIGASSKKKLVRRLVISKQTSIYYKVIRGSIYLITLYDNRQNPDKLRYL